MQKIFLSLVIVCFLSISSKVYGQTTVSTNITSPTEVGKTTMPPGQYLMTEVGTGKQYSLTVTDKGNMIFGPAPTAPTAANPAAANKAATGAKGMAEKGVEKFIQNKGMSEIQNFIK